MTPAKCPKCGTTDQWKWEQEMGPGVLSAGWSLETGSFELIEYDGDGYETTYSCGNCEFTCHHDAWEQLSRDGVLPVEPHPFDGRPYDIGERPIDVGESSWDWLGRRAANGSFTAYSIAQELRSLKDGLHDAWAELNRRDVAG